MSSKLKKSVSYALLSFTDLVNSSKDDQNEKQKKIAGFMYITAAMLELNKSKHALKAIIDYMAANFTLFAEINRESLLKSIVKIDEMETAVEYLGSLHKEEKEQIIRLLIETARIHGTLENKSDFFILDLGKYFFVSEYTISQMLSTNTQKNSAKTKKRLLESSTGLIAAIIIIIIFILAATFFKSVVFGLILAYFFIPLQRFYKRFLFQSRPAIILGKIVETLFLPVTIPLHKLMVNFNQFAKIKKHKKKLSEAELHNERLTTISCQLTILTVVIIFIVILGSAYSISSSYIKEASHSISTWTQNATRDYEIHVMNQSPVEAEATASQELKQGYIYNFKQFMNVAQYKINSIKPMIEKSPALKFLRKYAAKYLNNPDDLKKITLDIISKSGGIFSYATGAISTLFYVAMNTVFTFFFFAYFLTRLARFNAHSNTKATAGEYISNGLMKSKWFPYTNLESISTTSLILDNVLNKLKAWIRGYLTIIIIEVTFYTLAFTFIGIPFGILLGVIAGFTILLPYLGPIMSIIITLVVCLLVGNVSMAQMGMVILAYVIMTGVLDQLFIYPAVVGGALGLNELETIVIVLLGGIIAGITGMIFAVPVAAVLKYLIPEIYRLYKNETESRSSETIIENTPENNKTVP